MIENRTAENRTNGNPATDNRTKKYEGKAKIVWEPGTGDEAALAEAGLSAADVYVVEFKDSATAFDGKKKGTIGGKGRCNNLISARLFELLEREGVPTHFVRTVSDHEMLVRRLRIIPVEVVVRNVAAGSLAKRLGLEEGTPLPGAVLELNYKRDDLGDPMVNRYHIRAMDLATEDEMDRVEELALRINDILGKVLGDCDLRLIDFKLEFGLAASGEVVLGDEISPDTCRFWDTASGEKLDKDRFRRDLGGVEEAYEEVLRRVTAASERWQAKWPAAGGGARTASGGKVASAAEPAAPAEAGLPAAYHAPVFVTLKKTVLDPQGVAVQNALRSLGYSEVADVRVGKFITLELTEASRERVDEMCRRLLANPVIEDYTFEIKPHPGGNRRPDGQPEGGR